VNRRQMLATMVAGFGAALGAWPRSSLAAVDPMTVATIASTSIGLIQGFVKKGDGGLSAMLRAQFELLTVVIGQLEQVQASLGRIEEAIADLPSQMREIVRRQYGDQLIAQIRGGVGEYNSFLRAYVLSPSVMESEPVRRQLGDILSRAADRRSTLAVLDYGRGPEAAMVLPISMALEIACLSHLRFPTPIIRSRLVDYSNWIDLMMRPGLAGSIPTRRAEAVATHDALIDAAVQANPLASRMGLARMKLSAPDSVNLVGVSPCAYLCVVDIDTEGGRNGPTSLGARKLLGEFCPGGYMGSRSVKLAENPTLGIFLFEQDELDMATTRSSASLGPPAGRQCDIRRIPSQGSISELPAARTSHFVNKAYPFLRNEHQSALGATLANANEQRAQIALTLHATALLDHTRRQLAEFRTTLGD
jgi:hypothetical protein